MLLGVSATITRAADSEWSRQCERIRKCSSLIGKVNQWRAYCEGQWSEKPPGDLKDVTSVASDPFVAPTPSDSREGSGETGSTSHSRPRTPGQSTTPGSPQMGQHRRRISPLPSPGEVPPLNSGPPSTTDLQEKQPNEFDPSTIGSFGGPGFGTLTASFPAPPTTLPTSPISPERGSKLRKSSLVAMNITTTPTKSSTTNGDPDKAEKLESPNNGSAGKSSRVAAMRDKYDKRV